MPLFGKKKKDEKKEQGSDIEAPEEDGLLMARGSAAPAPEAAADTSVEGGDSEPDLEAATEDDAVDLSALDGDLEETPEQAETPTAAVEAEEKSNADDLLSAFEDDDSGGDLKDITKDIEDVPIADLLAELREIRTTLPPDALETGQDVA